jgi:hypothetical protein
VDGSRDTPIADRLKFLDGILKREAASEIFLHVLKRIDQR